MIRTSPELEVCAGELGLQKRWLEDVFTYFGRAPEDTTFRMFLFTPEDFDGLCGSGESISGCADDGVAYVRRDFAIRHELMHLVHQTLVGSSHRALNEGLASAFGDGASVHELREGFQKPLGKMFNDSQFSEGSTYRGTATLFTHFLLARYSPETYLRFFAAVPREASLQTIDEASRRVLGKSLAELDAEWQSAELCASDYTPCTDADVETLRVPFEIESAAHCEDENTYGVQGPPDLIGWNGPLHLYEVEVTEERLYKIVTVGARVMFSLCDEQCLPLRTERFDVRADVTQPLKIEPGVYRATVFPRTADGSYELAVLPYEPPKG